MDLDEHMNPITGDDARGLEINTQIMPVTSIPC